MHHQQHPVNHPISPRVTTTQPTRQHSPSITCCWVNNLQGAARSDPRPPDCHHPHAHLLPGAYMHVIRSVSIHIAQRMALWVCICRLEVPSMLEPRTGSSLL
jgi:hypothetical protein